MEIRFLFRKVIIFESFLSWAKILRQLWACLSLPSLVWPPRPPSSSSCTVDLYLLDVYIYFRIGSPLHQTKRSKDFIILFSISLFNGNDDITRKSSTSFINDSKYTPLARQTAVLSASLHIFRSEIWQAYRTFQFNMDSVCTLYRNIHDKNLWKCIRKPGKNPIISVANHIRGKIPLLVVQNMSFCTSFLFLKFFFFNSVPSNAHISTPFFQKIVFFSKICFGSPPSKILEVCLNSESMWKWSQVYSFNSARAIKKLLSALSKLPPLCQTPRHYRIY